MTLFPHQWFPQIIIDDTVKNYISIFTLFVAGNLFGNEITTIYDSLYVTTKPSLYDGEIALAQDYIDPNLTLTTTNGQIPSNGYPLDVREGYDKVTETLKITHSTKKRHEIVKIVRSINTENDHKT